MKQERDKWKQTNKEREEEKKEREEVESKMKQENDELKKWKQEMEKWKEEQEKKEMEWEKFKSKKGEFISKGQQKLKEKEKQEAVEVENWNLKKLIARRITSLQDVQINKKLGSGCDGTVFLCSVEGIGDVALKLIANMGVSTKKVTEYFNNEYNVLKSIPTHKNIIPILCEFEDRPTDPFYNGLTSDLQALAVHPNGTRRMTKFFLMPSFLCFEKFFIQEYRSLSIGQKVEFISDICEGLFFLFENDVAHLDMKLNNLLINSSGRVIICDFGHSKKLNKQKQAYLSPFGSLGGNLEHLAPECKLDNSEGKWVDYSKQPSFELGMIAHEIIFGQSPENKFGEQMDEQYFCSLCPDASHHNGKLFGWMKGLLMREKEKRTQLEASRMQFAEIIEEQRNKDFVEEFYPGVF